MKSLTAAAVAVPIRRASGSLAEMEIRAALRVKLWTMLVTTPARTPKAMTCQNKVLPQAKTATDKSETSVAAAAAAVAAGVAAGDVVNEVIVCLPMVQRSKQQTAIRMVITLLRYRKKAAANAGSKSTSGNRRSLTLTPL